MYKDVLGNVFGIKSVLQERRKKKSNLTLYYFVIAKRVEKYANGTNKYIRIVYIDKDVYIL